MTDIVERLRRLAERERPYGSLPDTLDEAAAEIERLRAGGCARDQGTTQYCAEAAKLAAENERLRAALEDVVQEVTEHHAENVSRAELGGSDMAQRKAKAIVSRSGVLLYKIRFIARAALEGRT